MYISSWKSCSLQQRPLFPAWSIETGLNNQVSNYGNYNLKLKQKLALWRTLLKDRSIGMPFIHHEVSNHSSRINNRCAVWMVNQATVGVRSSISHAHIIYCKHRWGHDNGPSLLHLSRAFVDTTDRRPCDVHVNISPAGAPEYRSIYLARPIVIGKLPKFVGRPEVNTDVVKHHLEFVAAADAASNNDFCWR